MQQKLLIVATAIVMSALFTAISVQPAFAPTCPTCAKGFAPGHESVSLGSGLPGDAKNFAPGHQVPPGPGTQLFAPGIEKK